MLPHGLMEGGILFVQSANGNEIPLNGIPFPFVSVKMNFESSIKLPFLLVAACFRVTPKEVTRTVKFC